MSGDDDALSRFGPLQAWPDREDAQSWRFAPTVPRFQRTGDGHPQFSRLDVGGMIFLTVGITLAPTEAELGQARAAIARSTGLADAAPTLRPADVTITAATLVLEGDKTPVVLASVKASPLAPWPAAFGASVPAEQAALLQSALDGHGGALAVICDVELAGRRTARATLSGPAPEAGRVEAALAAGTLTLALEADADASEELRTEARRRVVERAETALGRQSPAGLMADRTTASLDVTVTCTEHVTRALRLRSDLGALLRDE